MKTLLTIIIFCLSVTLISAEEGQDDGAVATIKKVIPSDWTITETKGNQLPYGHYDGVEYKGSGGEMLVLIGPADVMFNWKDRTGISHREPLAKETLKLWVMPLDYKDSWKRIFVPKRSVPAELIADNNKTSVYAEATHEIVDKRRFNELLGKASSTGWPDAPHNNGELSWKSWRDDIRKALDINSNNYTDPSYVEMSSGVKPKYKTFDEAEKGLGVITKYYGLYLKKIKSERKKIKGGVITDKEIFIESL